MHEINLALKEYDGQTLPLYSEGAVRFPGGAFPGPAPLVVVEGEDMAGGEQHVEYRDYAKLSVQPKYKRSCRQSRYVFDRVDLYLDGEWRWGEPCRTARVRYEPEQGVLRLEFSAF